MGLKGVDYDELVEKRVKAQKRASAAINTKGRATDRRQRGEIRSRRDAIISFCTECMTSYGDDNGGCGTIAAAIRDCCAPECHLYPWRCGPLDVEAIDGR